MGLFPDWEPGLLPGLEVGLPPDLEPEEDVLSLLVFPSRSGRPSLRGCRFPPEESPDGRPPGFRPGLPPDFPEPGRERPLLPSELILRTLLVLALLLLPGIPFLLERDGRRS